MFTNFMTKTTYKTFVNKLKHNYEKYHCVKQLTDDIN